MLKRFMVFLTLIMCSFISLGHSKQIDSKISALQQEEFLYLVTWDWDSISKCKNGTIIYFNSEKTSTEQVMWAAFMFADFNYPVIVNGYTMLCVFTDVRVKQIKEKYFPK